MPRVFASPLLIVTVLMASAACASKAKRPLVPTTAVPNVVTSNGQSQDAATSTGTGTASGGAITIVMVARSGSSAKGTLTLNAVDDHLQLSGTVSGLTPGGKHALHIQSVGSCEAEDGSSAGDDFVPQAPSGSTIVINPSIGPLSADASGKAEVKLTIAGYSLSLGQPANILSRSLVIYEKDDSASGSGRRWACGRIDAGSEATPDKATLYRVSMTLANAATSGGGALDVRQVDAGVAFSGVVSGLTPNSNYQLEIRGAAGQAACTGDFASAGTVFAPFTTAASDGSSSQVALGDLGSLQADASGKVVINLTRQASALSGLAGVVGRAVTLRALAPTAANAAAASAATGALAACGLIQ